MKASRVSIFQFGVVILINCSSHTSALWMKAPSIVRTKCLSFSILLASLRTWRIFWLLFLYRKLILLLPFILHYLRFSCNQCLISGRLNDPHLDQLVMLMSERFNEAVKSGQLPVWSSELHKMKCWYKDRVVYTKFWENGKDDLIILLLNLLQLQLEH